MTRASTAAHNVLEDLQMLEAGTWVPDEGSLGDSITNAEFVYERIQRYEKALHEIALHMENDEFYMRRIAGGALND